jgi:putative membrane protein
MFLRLPSGIYLSALTLAAVACKSSDTVPSNTPAAHRASSSESADESGVNSETSAPLPQAAVTPFEPEQAVSANQPAPKQASLDDAEIAAITDAANGAEIEQGRLARQKAKDPRVRDFASMMVDHHGEARREQQKLSLEPSENADSKRMQADARDALKALKGKSGKEFDQAYLQLQIEEHRKVLRALTDELLPSVKDSKLQAYLENIKPKVESHLAQAERLQEELNGTSSLNDSARPTISNSRGSNARLSQH